MDEPVSPLLWQQRETRYLFQKKKKATGVMHPPYLPNQARVTIPNERRGYLGTLRRPGLPKMKRKVAGFRHSLLPGLHNPIITNST